MSVMYQEDISQAFDRGVAKAAAYMVVKYGDYPVFCQNVNEAHDAILSTGQTMEVYDLNQDKKQQMRVHRAWNIPKDTRDPFTDIRLKELIR